MSEHNGKATSDILAAHEAMVNARREHDENEDRATKLLASRGAYGDALSTEQGGPVTEHYGTDRHMAKIAIRNAVSTAAELGLDAGEIAKQIYAGLSERPGGLVGVSGKKYSHLADEVVTSLVLTSHEHRLGPIISSTSERGR